MEFKLISEFNKELFFSYRNMKFIGIPLEVSLASEFRSSAIFHLNEIIIQGELPGNLDGVLIEYRFEDKDYYMKWICYFDSQPSESEEEIMSGIFGYVTGDMPNISNKEIAFYFEEKYLHQSLPKISTSLNNWVYLNSKKFYCTV